MDLAMCSRSRWFAVAAVSAAAMLAGLGQANCAEPTAISERVTLVEDVPDSTPTISNPTTVAVQAPAAQAPSEPALEIPVDAFGYVGGLFEARFYEPHATTDDPHEEIRQAAELYGVDLAMMNSIARIESGFNPRARTGSYKGLFQVSDYEFAKYGDGNIYDARDNARAAAHMFLVQAEKFEWALGHFPDYAERYMVHQQGIQGAIEHYTHPKRAAWQSMCATEEGMRKGEQWCKRAIWGNLLPEWKQAFGSVDKISSDDFVTLWTGRVAYFTDGPV